MRGAGTAVVDDGGEPREEPVVRNLADGEDRSASTRQRAAPVRVRDDPRPPGRPSAAAVRLLNRLAESGTSLHIRADDDTAGQEIVKALQSSIPSTQLWRYDQRPPETSRYEEQDLEVLLADLDSLRR